MKRNKDILDNLTINIPTWERQDNLARLLACLVNQDYKFDLAFNKNGLKSQSVLQILDILELRHDIRVVEDTPLVETRQTMLEKSRQFCLFIDDDVILTNQVIQKLSCLDNYPTYSFCSPCIYELRNYRGVKNWVRDFPGERPAKHPYGTYENLDNNLDNTELQLIDTTCILLRTQDALKSGGFVGAPCPGEHLALSRRLESHGYKGLLAPSAVVYHCPSLLNAPFANQAEKLLKEML